MPRGVRASPSRADRAESKRGQRSAYRAYRPSEGQLWILQQQQRSLRQRQRRLQLRFTCRSNNIAKYEGMSTPKKSQQIVA